MKQYQSSTYQGSFQVIPKPSDLHVLLPHRNKWGNLFKLINGLKSTETIKTDYASFGKTRSQAALRNLRINIGNNYYKKYKQSICIVENDQGELFIFKRDT